MFYDDYREFFMTVMEVPIRVYRSLAEDEADMSVKVIIADYCRKEDAIVLQTAS